MMADPAPHNSNAVEASRWHSVRAFLYADAWYALGNTRGQRLGMGFLRALIWLGAGVGLAVGLYFGVFAGAGLAFVGVKAGSALAAYLWSGAAGLALTSMFMYAHAWCARSKAKMALASLGIMPVLSAAAALIPGVMGLLSVVADKIGAGFLGQILAYYVLPGVAVMLVSLGAALGVQRGLERLGAWGRQHALAKNAKAEIPSAADSPLKMEAGFSPHIETVLRNLFVDRVVLFLKAVGAKNVPVDMKVYADALYDQVKCESLPTGAEFSDQKPIIVLGENNVRTMKDLESCILKEYSCEMNGMVKPNVSTVGSTQLMASVDNSNAIWDVAATIDLWLKQHEAVVRKGWGKHPKAYAVEDAIQDETDTESDVNVSTDQHGSAGHIRRKLEYPLDKPLQRSKSFNDLSERDGASQIKRSLSESSLTSRAWVARNWLREVFVERVAASAGYDFSDMTDAQGQNQVRACANPLYDTLAWKVSDSKVSDSGVGEDSNLYQFGHDGLLTMRGLEQIIAKEFCTVGGGKVELNVHSSFPHVLLKDPENDAQSIFDMDGIVDQLLEGNADKVCQSWKEQVSAFPWQEDDSQSPDWSL